MKVLLIASIVACVALGVAAHGGSGNRNCQWGSWSGWGECSSRLDVASGAASVGSRSRSRGFAVTRRGGGAPCRGPSGDSQTCRACSLTQWTQWSECDGTQRTRSRNSIQNGGQRAQFRNQGLYCPISNSNLAESAGCANCVWEWGQWGACDGSSRTRVINVLVNPSDGTPCPTNADGSPFSESQVCNHCIQSRWSQFSACVDGSQSRTRSTLRNPVNGGNECGPTSDASPCRNCQEGAWGDWSVCYSNGKQRRRRSVTEAQGENVALCTGTLEEKDCVPDRIDCAHTGWVKSGDCDGRQKFTSSITTVANEAGDTCVEAEENVVASCGAEAIGCTLTKTETCTAPPIPCEFGEWGEWSVCGVADEAKTRKRPVVKAALHNGACPKSSMVDELPCPKNCTLSEWGQFSDCNDEQKQTRTRTIATPAKHGGTCDADLEETTSCPVFVESIDDIAVLSPSDMDEIDLLQAESSHEHEDTSSAALGIGGATGTMAVLTVLYRRNKRRSSDEDDSDEEEDGEEMEKTSKTVDTGDVELVANDALAEGWTEATDPNTGKVYFYHRQRGLTTWDRAEAQM